MTSRNHRRRRKNSVNKSGEDHACTSSCQCLSHGDIVTRCAALGNLELLKHCSNLCRNVWSIRDDVGRDVLLTCSSCGHLETLLWLLERRRRFNIDSCDDESHWNGLHRGSYHGHAGLCVSLVKNGCNINELDNDGLTPLNLLQQNFQLLDTPPRVSSVCLYTWGSNPNMTLGHQYSRSSPEVLDSYSSMESIKQVVICKYHTILLDTSGVVYTCGHGMGGRLGHGTGISVVSPKAVETIRSEVCTFIAGARNHSVFLMESGVVYSCGLNDAHQLGQCTKHGAIPPISLIPYVMRYLKGKAVVTGVGAGRYHTAVCTKDELYTFGRNMGQLGYEKIGDTQIQPKVVYGITVDNNDGIAYVSVSDAATAVITAKRHQIYVCTNYTVVRCDRISIPDSISVVQFAVCASLGELEHKSKKKKDNESAASKGPTLAVLDSNNQLWMSHWSDSNKKSALSPQIILGSNKRKVTQFCLGKYLSVVTKEGELYRGALASPPSLLSLSRTPLVQQAQAVYTDYKGANYAVLQNVYAPPQLPQVEASMLTLDLYRLWNSEALFSSVSDVKGQEVLANKLILASRSSLFASLSSDNYHTSPLIKAFSVQDSKWLLTLGPSTPLLFNLFLHCVYGGQLVVRAKDISPKAPPKSSLPAAQASCDSSPSKTDASSSIDWNSFYDQYDAEDAVSDTLDKSFDSEDPRNKLTSISEVSLSGDDYASDLVKVLEVDQALWRKELEQLQYLAVELQVEDLAQCLGQVLSPERKKFHSCVIKCSPLSILPETFSHDVLLISEEKKIIHCHKCVLVARSEYFQSMLLMGWRESSNSDSVVRLDLQIPHYLLEVIVEYLYTDSVKNITTHSLDFLTALLTIADQLLLNRLKTMCEESIVKTISLRNVAELLEFSLAYNADQLQHSCLLFACVNFPALLEARLLETVSHTTLELLSKTYRELFTSVSQRTIQFAVPMAHELPPSYLNNEPIEFSDDETDEVGVADTTGDAAVPNRTKSPLQDTLTSNKNKTTPSSGSKKKRRRKTSTKDETPPTSPDPLTVNNVRAHTNSPEPVQRSLTFEDGDKESDTQPDTRIKNVDAGAKRSDKKVKKETDANSDSKAVKSNTNGEVAHRQSNSHVKVPWGGQSIGNRSMSVPTMKDIMASEQEEANRSKTTDNKKGKRNKTTPKPIKITNSATNISEPRSSPKNILLARSESVPSVSGGNPWGVVTSSSNISLKELMQREERAELAAQAPPTNSRLHRSHSQERADVSIRRKLSSSIISPSVISPSRIVSFADIITSQQQEMDKTRQSQKKPLHLIQKRDVSYYHHKKEQAIQELLQLYHANDSPEEYITIEQYPQDPGTISDMTRPSQKTCAPVSEPNNVWDKGSLKFR